jgi:lysozyme
LHRVGSSWRAVAGVVALATLLALAIPAEATPSGLPGIDVSEYQKTINWAKVRAAGVQFVVIRATKGRFYEDPTFHTNFAGAQAHGIVVGAYHRARAEPNGDGGANLADARKEADFFLTVAVPTAGHLIPALDIEETGGLAPTQLIAWVKAWVTRVRSVLGVRPMIYTSPNFWNSAMGSSAWFARHGYKLWIADWRGNATPEVPAGDWHGQGWLAWQWTHKPGLPGITTDLDRDVLDGTNLADARIARVQVQSGAGGSVADGSGRLGCGDGTACEALFDPRAIVSLRATPNAGGVFLSWDGACSAAGPSPACTVTALNTKRTTATFGYPLTVAEIGDGGGTVISTPGGVSCPGACSADYPTGSTVTLQAAADSSSEFDGWSGACTGSGPCTVTMDGVRSVAASFADLAPPSAVITPPISLSGSVRVAFSEPVHHVTTHNVVLRRGGVALDASLVCRDAEGAPVSCEDGDVGAAALHPRTPLVAGQSYVAAVDLPGSGPIVDRAGFPVPAGEVPFRAATSLEEADPGMAFAWGVRQDPRATGASYISDHRAGASVSFRFGGPDVTLRTVVGPGFGRARIAIDGRFVATIDGYARAFGARDRTWRHLGHRSHTLTVTATGTADARATGTRVGVDALIVNGRTYRSPSQLAATWSDVASADASGGSYAVADVASSWTSFRFRGVGITLATRTGPTFGRAQLWIDGALARRLDLSSSTPALVHRAVTGLADRVHTVKLIVVGAPGSSGTGTAVAVDGWQVS